MGIRVKNGRLEYRFMIGGQKVQESTGLADTERNRKKAAEMETAHRQAILEGRLGVRRLTPRFFSDAAPEFLAHLAAVRQAASTVHRIKTSMASAVTFFGRELVSMIHTGLVEQYIAWRLNEHRVKPVTVKHDVDNLSLFFQWAVKNRYARENPTRAADKPSDKDAKREHVLSEAEERAYFSVVRGSLRDLARLILLQGARPDEVLNMRKVDVDLDRGTWSISRSKTTAGKRTLKLAPESIGIIARRIGTVGPWVFPSPKSPERHLSKLNCPHDRALEKLNACRDCGKPEGAHPATKCGTYRSPAVKVLFVLYDLRHTFGTRMVASGCDLATLKAIMGHTDIRITQRYVHPTREEQFTAMQRYHERATEGKGAIQ